jgi:hypothetical protein
MLVYQREIELQKLKAPLGISRNTGLTRNGASGISLFMICIGIKTMGHLKVLNW